MIPRRLHSETISSMLYLTGNGTGNVNVDVDVDVAASTAALASDVEVSSAAVEKWRLLLRIPVRIEEAGLVKAETDLVESKHTCSNIVIPTSVLVVNEKDMQGEGIAGTVSSALVV